MRRVSKSRRFVEACLLLAGVAAVDVYLWANFRTAVYQNWDNWVFERKVSGQPVSLGQYLRDKEIEAFNTVAGWLCIHPATVESVRNTRPAPPLPAAPHVANGDLLGRIAIPRLHVDAMVREGADKHTLELAAGHIPGTALPGQPGNVGVAAHRDTLFRGLRNVTKNDQVLFETLGGTYIYKVESTGIVTPKDVGVLSPGKYPEMTLVTCYPFYYIGSAPDRFVVHARLVSQAPATQQAALNPQPQLSKPQPKSVPRVTQVAMVTPQPAHLPPPAQRQPDLDRSTFSVTEGHSREVAPGILLGLSFADPYSHSASGWIWLTRDRRTIWLHDQHAHEPLIFYGYSDGKEHELVLTSIARNSATGYLQLYPGAQSWRDRYRTR